MNLEPPSRPGTRGDERVRACPNIPAPRNRFAVVAVAGALSLLCGCGKEKPEDAIRRVASDTKLSNKEAVRQIAERIFPRIERCAASVDEEGSVTLELVVRGKESPSVTTVGDADAAHVDANVELGVLCFQCRRLIDHAAARRLEAFDILLRHSVLDPVGQRAWVDVFKFRLRKDQFAGFLERASGPAVVRGAQAVLHEVCDVEFDRFDQIRYREKRE